jgi:hypothetical protein
MSASMSRGSRLGWCSAAKPLGDGMPDRLATRCRHPGDAYEMTSTILHRTLALPDEDAALRPAQPPSTARLAW